MRCPFGLLLCGVTLDTYVEHRGSCSTSQTPIACLIRLARYRRHFCCWRICARVDRAERVLVVQAAMPSGMMPLVLARHTAAGR